MSVNNLISTKRKKIFAASALVSALALLFGYFYFFPDQPDQLPKNITVDINGHGLVAEVAATDKERTQGLSGRTSLCSGCAMIFIFEKKDTYFFWMKDMKFDLDMLWINGSEIVQIDKNVPYAKGMAEVRSSEAQIDKVLEIPAGESEKLGIKVGDVIKF